LISEQGIAFSLDYPALLGKRHEIRVSSNVIEHIMHGAGRGADFAHSSKFF